MAYFVVLAVLCILIFGILLSAFFFSKLSRTTRQYNQAMLHRVRTEMDAIVQNVTIACNQLALNSLVNKYAGSHVELDYLEIKALSEMIAGIVSSSDYLDSVYLIYPAHSKAITSFGLFGLDTFPDQSWRRAEGAAQRYLWAGERQITKEPMSLVSSSVVTMICRIPLYQPGGGGFLVFNIRGETLTGILSGAGWGQSHILVLDRELEPLISSLPPSEWNLLQTAGGSFQVDPSENLIPFGAQQGYLRLKDGLYRLDTYRDAVSGWSYLVFSPVQEVYRDVLTSLGIVLLFAAGVILLGTGLSLGLRRAAYRPIRQLVDHVGGGDMPAGIQEFAEFAQIRSNVGTLRQEKDALQRQMVKILPQLREKFFSELIAGTILNEEQIAESLGFLCVDCLHCKSFAVSSLWIDNSRGLSGEAAVYHKLELQNVVCQQSAVEGVFCCTAGENGRMLSFVFGFEDREEMGLQIRRIHGKLMGYVAQNLPFTITVGVGRWVDNLLAVQISANQAAEALEQSFLYGSGQVIYFRSTERGNGGLYINPLVYEKPLARAIKTPNIPELRKLLEDIRNLVARNYHDIRLIRQFYLNLVNVISALGPRNGAESPSQGLNRLVERILNAQSLREIHSIMEELSQESARRFELQRTEKALGTVEEILAYLRENYSRDISLDDVAAQIAYTPAYINRILRHHTGRTFYDTLTEIRIAGAKELLQSTEEQVYHIAEMVGYSNNQSFIRMFKKVVGTTPGKYRASSEQREKSSGM